MMSFFWFWLVRDDDSEIRKNYSLGSLMIASESSPQI
jgi:hypothetical protein